MIVILLIFTLLSAFTAATITMIMGFSFWIALALYPVTGIVALVIGAAAIAFSKTYFAVRQTPTGPSHA